MEDPELLAPVGAGVIKLVARFALAGTKAIGLAEIDRFIAKVEPVKQVLIDKLLKLRIGHAVLAAPRGKALPSDQCKVLRMRFFILIQRNRPSIRMPAENIIDQRKPIVGDVVEAASPGVSDVEFNRRRFLHIQISRNDDLLHRQKFKGRRFEQVHLRRVSNRAPWPKVRIEKPRARVFPQKISHTFGRADLIPTRPRPLAFLWRRRRMVVPGDEDVSPHNLMHVAPALQLCDIYAVGAGQRGVAEIEARFRRSTFVFRHHRHFKSVSL